MTDEKTAHKDKSKATREAKREAALDDALEDSFPASDPPQMTVPVVKTRTSEPPAGQNPGKGEGDKESGKAPKNDNKPGERRRP
jgi:hypothetical protein